MRTLSLAALITAATLSATSLSAIAKNTAAGIVANQVGFNSQSPKVAVVPNVASNDFTLTDKATGRIVYNGKLSAPKSWSEAKETVRLADFSSVQYPGEYTLSVDGIAQPFAVTIDENVYQEALSGAIKYYYFNRNSAALQKEHAGIYHRPASHPDTTVYVDASAATPERPVGTVLSLPKGWFDAGDFSKYIVNSSITVHTLLRALDNHPALFAKLNLNIPESNNNIPDLLDEILWNLDWMVSMQDTDGGLYHKLTAKRFEPVAMPHTQYKPRFVVQKTTAATLDYAATLALASRVIAQYEEQFPGRAEQYRAAALKAWDWAEENPNVLFEQPEGFRTGMYRLDGDDYKDEWAWARAELFVLTGKRKFLKGYEVANTARTPEWSDVETLGMLALANHAKTPSSLKQQILDTLKKSADTWVKQAHSSGYGVAMFGRDFRWGSNGVAANKALALIDINKLVPNPQYLETAQALVDYILGRNPNGLSYLTGFGENTPMHPHHRVSEVDGIQAPIPGMLAGGPHKGYQDKKECNVKYNVDYDPSIPSKAYFDHWCSYATNEVAINWNAALVYVLAELN
ncbi:glycoside hydrolase family 9 protein [Marinagarivorans algicola]|uniref:glycoside hydrolase family 9 protein n=1 Tax=Marinagarivorans algicola TaxID=1513270 RepID=UPI0006B46DAC|nr:glycoside hydrolase family 9 protein [Marinagarivorans algicola]